MQRPGATATSYTLNPAAYSTTRPCNTNAPATTTDPSTHDANGNLTRLDLGGRRSAALTWNAENRLTTITDSTTGTGGAPTPYTYDHTGTLSIRRQTTGGHTWHPNPWVT